MLYLQLVRMAKNIKHNISALLMAPVQRITRYPLLLNEIERLYAKAKDIAEEGGKNLTSEQEGKVFFIKEASLLALDVANYVNDMMEAGKILGYPVSIRV